MTDRAKDGRTLKRAEDLIALLRKAGVPDPEVWVKSEIEEDIAQVARVLFLTKVWPTAIDTFTADLSWIDEAIEGWRADAGGFFADAGAALDTALSAGVTREDLGKIARSAAYRAVFEVLYRVDAGGDEELQDAPGWILMEYDPELEQLTGRDVGGLHEDLLTMDPSGREGRPGE